MSEFSFPGCLDAGEVTQEYEFLVDRDLNDVDNDELLWKCWRQVLKLHLPTITEFLKQRSEDVAWKIKNTGVSDCFGDLYFGVSLIRKSITSMLDEVEAGPEDDAGAQKIERLSNACDAVTSRIVDGFRFENKDIDYGSWKTAMLSEIKALILLIEELSSDVEQQNLDIAQLFYDLGKTAYEVASLADPETARLMLADLGQTAEEVGVVMRDAVLDRL